MLLKTWCGSSIECNAVTLRRVALGWVRYGWHCFKALLAVIVLVVLAGCADKAITVGLGEGAAVKMGGIISDLEVQGPACYESRPAEHEGGACHKYQHATGPDAGGSHAGTAGRKN